LTENTNELSRYEKCPNIFRVASPAKSWVLPRFGDGRSGPKTRWRPSALLAAGLLPLRQSIASSKGAPANRRSLPRAEVPTRRLMSARGVLVISYGNSW